VRAPVNASTDFGSLTPSLLQPRDKKQKSIRELECKVLSELRPQLDQVVTLEVEFKKASLDVEVLQEQVDKYKAKVSEVSKAAEREAEADKAAMVGLLNERSEAAQALEKVLVSLSTDPEIKRAQDEHEAEKAEAIKKSMSLQEELREAESKEQFTRRAFTTKMDGVVATARNLGQTAAYFLSTGEVAEAADFYMQAKAMFDGLLGPEHQRTRQWQEDLFFLINAPSIQQLVRQAKKGRTETAATGDAGDDAADEWWMKGLFEIGATEGGDDAAENNWWMQNLFSMDYMGGGAADEEYDAEYMQQLLSSKEAVNDGKALQSVFTPRGTLVALSEVNGNKGAAISLGGKPLQKQLGIPEDQQVDDAAVNMDFAKEWIAKVFETPREGAAGRVGATNESELAQQKSDAFKWLHANFGNKKGAGVEDAENRAPMLQ